MKSLNAIPNMPLIPRRINYNWKLLNNEIRERKRRNSWNSFQNNGTLLLYVYHGSIQAGFPFPWKQTYPHVKNLNFLASKQAHAVYLQWPYTIHPTHHLSICQIFHMIGGYIVVSIDERGRWETSKIRSVYVMLETFLKFSLKKMVLKTTFNDFENKILFINYIWKINFSFYSYYTHI